MKKTLYIDIETIPGPESGMLTIEVKPPANIKKQESIDKWHEEKGQNAIRDKYLKQSFNGGYGRVCSISYAVDDGSVFNSSALDRDAETQTMIAAFDTIDGELDGHSNPFVCGHFVSGFDLRFLMHRCVVLGVKMPHWLQTTANAKPWDAKLRDTMQLWCGNRDTIGLDELCTILGIPGKGDVGGSMVYQMWLDGRHEEIGEYCSEDVEKVRAVNKRFIEAGL